MKILLGMACLLLTDLYASGPGRGHPSCHRRRRDQWILSVATRPFLLRGIASRPSARLTESGYPTMRTCSTPRAAFSSQDCGTCTFIRWRTWRWMRSLTSVAARDWHFSQFLAYGVTGVRNMNDGTGDVRLDAHAALPRAVALRGVDRDGAVPPSRGERLRGLAGRGAVASPVLPDVRIPARDGPVGWRRSRAQTSSLVRLLRHALAVQANRLSVL